MTDSKVLRGGSLLSLPRGCGSAYRFSNHPDYRNNRVGFRVVCPPDPAPAPAFPALKVLRGGSWLLSPRDCRSAFRDCVLPVYRSNLVGFRVCCLSQGPSDPILNRDHHHAMTTPLNATPEQWRDVELASIRDRLATLETRGQAEAEAWATISRACCGLRDRLAAAEQRISELQTTHNTGVDRLQYQDDCLLKLRDRLGAAEQRISELERLQSWVTPEMADTLDSLASRLSALETNRPAAAVKDSLTAQTAPAGSLVAEACNAITKRVGFDSNWTPEVCTVICACALWLERREFGSALAAARLLREEVKRHG